MPDNKRVEYLDYLKGKYAGTGLEYVDEYIQVEIAFQLSRIADKLERA